MAMMDEQMADIERYAIAFLNNELCKHIELLFSPLQGFVSDVTNYLKNGLKDRSANRLENEHNISNIDKLLDGFIRHYREVDQMSGVLG